MKFIRSKNCSKIVVLFMTIILIVNTSSMSTFADVEVSNINEIYISEDNYDETMNEDVMPYLNSIMQDGYIEGEDNVKLYYRTYLVENSIGSIVISHGLTEYIERYSEIIYYYAKSGYNVFVMEHRGHGRSETLGVIDETQVNVYDFEHYVSDFKVFMDEVVVPQSVSDDDLFLYAHSMGGAIASKFLIDNPGYFDAAVLNAPMMTVNTGGVPGILADIMASTATFFGFGDNYVPGERPYMIDQDLEKISTSSLSRFKFAYGLEIANEVVRRGGPSLRWLNEAIDVTKYITSEKNASKVEIPIILFQAEDDAYVKDKGHNKFAKYAKNCTVIEVDESKHEIYRESDDIQKDVISKIIDFYSVNNIK